MSEAPEVDAGLAFEGSAEREKPRAELAALAAFNYGLWVLAPLALAGIVYALSRGLATTPLSSLVAISTVFAVLRMLPPLARGQSPPPRTSVRLRADAKGLSCDGVLVAWRGDIVRGSVAPLPRGGARVAIVTETPMGFEDEHRFLVPREKDARALLEACGVAPAQRSFAFRAAPPVLVWPFVIAAGMLCATALSAAVGVWTDAPVVPVLVVLAIVGLLAAGLQFARTRVEIGIDGVKLSGGEDEFIGRNDIESVEVGSDRVMDSGVVTVRTKAGRSFVIRPPARSGFGTRNLAGVADRIAQIRALPPSGAHLLEVQGLLARGERTVGEWLASVRALGAGRSDYRTIPVEAEDLATLATDGALSPEVRVAAAVALKSSPAPSAGERVRVAAAACAAPGVRVCLESIAREESEEEVVGKVGELRG